MRKFYKTKFIITVLSETPIQDIGLDHLYNEVTHGDCVLQKMDSREQIVSGKIMAKELFKAGSEPGFFRLDKDGKEMIIQTNPETKL